MTAADRRLGPGRRLALAVGVAVTLLGVGLVVAPDAVRSVPLLGGLATAPTGEDAERLALVLTGIALLAAGGTARATGGAASAAFDPFLRRSPERIADDRATVGADVDRQVARAVTAGGEELAAIRTRLRRAAVAAASRGGREPEAAEAAVDAGTWTDDPTAAAFLGEPGYPPAARARAWLDPPGERERRVRETVRAIRRAREEASG